MPFSGLDLSVWIAIYIGFCLIRSSMPIPKTEAAASPLRRSLAFAGYGLLVLAVAAFGFHTLHHHFR
jgi:hypothetical protein